MVIMKMIMLIIGCKTITITSKSFEYKTKLIGGTPIDNNTLNAEVENI